VCGVTLFGIVNLTVPAHYFGIFDQGQVTYFHWFRADVATSKQLLIVQVDDAFTTALP
jgi:hypothetical protein